MADLLKAEAMAVGLNVNSLQGSYKQPVLAAIVLVVRTIFHHHPPLM